MPDLPARQYPPRSYSLREGQHDYLTERGAEHDPPNASLALRQIIDRDIRRTRKRREQKEVAANADDC